jgi:hypothetical protein
VAQALLIGWAATILRTRVCGTPVLGAAVGIALVVFLFTAVPAVTYNP